MSKVIRPTKKQQEVLEFIERFIKTHGYSPTYREIMDGLGYASPATIVLHVRNLIKRGHLRIREGEARSLELAASSQEEQMMTERVKQAFDDVQRPVSREDLKRLSSLVDALEALGMYEVAAEFSRKLRGLIQGE